MGKLSQTDQHDPFVHTGQPNPEQPNVEEKNQPGQHIPVKKALHDKEETEQRKTGTR